MKMELGSSLKSVQYSEWIKDLIIAPDTLKAIEEKVGSVLQLRGTGKDFLSKTPLVTQKMQPAIDKRELVKLNNFCAERKRSVQ